MAQDHQSARNGKWAAFLPGALLILLGYADFRAIAHPQPPEGKTDWLLVLISFAPFIPVLAAVIVQCTNWRLNGLLAVLVTVLIGGTGGFVAFVAAAFSGNGALIVILQGITLTMALCASILFLGQHAFGVTHRIARWLFFVPVALAIWSISAGFVISISATRIADGRAFCLAQDGAFEPITNFADLRGFSFITTAWTLFGPPPEYFHGVLLVSAQDTPLIWNWTPRRFSFDPVPDPGVLLNNPSQQCHPIPGFLRTLRLAHGSGLNHTADSVDHTPHSPTKGTA